MVEEMCVYKALILNIWKMPSDLMNKTLNEMQSILIFELAQHLDSSVHSLQDLSIRSINFFNISIDFIFKCLNDSTTQFTRMLCS